MDTNDFLGSFAQENVSFQTSVVKTAVTGQNYWTVMIFVEPTRFVDTTQTGWESVAGSSTIKALSVTADDYTSFVVDNLLRSWLSDLFINGFTGNCILVSTGVDIAAGDTPDFGPFNTALETAYGLLKAYAYHKTVLAGATATALEPTIAVKLAQLCAADGYLSSAPYYPMSTATPETLASDPIYTALNTASVDAYLTYHADATRNGALYSLGVSLATVSDNGSGTCVGNSYDMVKSNNITSSGADDTVLSTTIKSILSVANIQYFKPVGDNTGYVASIGASSLKGTIMQAQWIISYITYMTKVAVATLITTPNYLRNASNYSSILIVMKGYLDLFGNSGSGRLTNTVITAPSFANIPASAGDTIIIQNAWRATYVDQVRNVQITGALYIG